MQHRADRKAAWAINGVLVETFTASFAEPPTELILDFDATDDPAHGRQEGRFFHGYYDHSRFLPLYVTCRDQLPEAYLRPANDERVSPSRGRRNPRKVKRKMSNYPVRPPCGPMAKRIDFAK